VTDDHLPPITPTASTSTSLPPHASPVTCEIRMESSHWALLGPGIELRRTPYDYAVACADIASASTFPDAAGWADLYVNARASAEDAIAAFGPRDGRDNSEDPEAR
jgi:hypothetical protein